MANVVAEDDNVTFIGAGYNLNSLKFILQNCLVKFTNGIFFYMDGRLSTKQKDVC